MTAMVRITLKALWARKRRLVGTSLAVFIGVAFLAGTLAFSDTMRADFDDLFTDASAGTDAAIRSDIQIEGEDGIAPPSTIDASIVDLARSVDGVAVAEPEIEGYGRIIGSDGEGLGGNGPPTFAGNWIEDPELNPYALVEGRAPETADEVVINRGAAEDGGLAVGDVTTVEVLSFMRRAVGEMGQTIVIVTHDPVAASYADAVVFLADGRIVDHLDAPTPQSVLDRLKGLGG